MITNINLPSFHGLYDSIWRDDDWDYWYRQEYGLEHLDDWSFNREEFFKDLAEAYTDFIEGQYRQYIYDGITLKFEGTWSPREYNFSTDKIYADIKVKNKRVFEKRVKELMDANKEELSIIIHNNHTSCDGFISFMSNDFNEWRKTFMTDGLVLAYTLCYLTAILGFEGELNRIDYTAYEFIEVREESYWYPDSDEAIAEWEEAQRKEEERNWDAAHFPELPLVYA